MNHASSPFLFLTLPAFSRVLNPEALFSSCCVLSGWYFPYLLLGARRSCACLIILQLLSPWAHGCKYGSKWPGAEESVQKTDRRGERGREGPEGQEEMVSLTRGSFPLRSQPSPRAGDASPHGRRAGRAKGGKGGRGAGRGGPAVPWISCPCSVPTPTPTPTPLFGNCLPQLVDVHVEGRLMIEGADPIGSSIRR